MLGWLIAIACFLLIWFIPLRLKAVYNLDGFSGKLYLGPIRIFKFPRKKKDEAEKKNTPVDLLSKQHKALKKLDKDEKKGGKLKEFKLIIREFLSFLNTLRKKITVKRLEAILVLANPDPADLAMSYGRAWAAVGSVFPLLENKLNVKKRNIEILCDFDAVETNIYAHADLRISLGRLVLICIVHEVRLIKKYSKTNSNEGGATNESKSS